MPVGTQGAVKALTHRELDRRRRADHPRQHLSPAPAARRRTRSRGAGGLHRFIGWDRRDPHRQRRLPGLQPRRAPQDHGGRRPLQVAPRRQRSLPARPESAVDIQAALGSDIAMVLDECLAWPSTRRRRPRRRWTSRFAGRRRARTAMLALRAGEASPGHDGSSLAPVPLITPGAGAVRHRAGRHAARRSATESAEGTVDIGFEAYAIGGLSVGEPPDVMYDVVEHTTPLLPADRPRYLMGVGTPDGPGRGRRARHRHVRLRAADAQRAQRPALHARRARLNIKNAQYAEDDRARGRCRASATPAARFHARICGILYVCRRDDGRHPEHPPQRPVLP